MSGVTGRAGPNWERICADYAALNGLPWDRAPLRGSRDLLDLSGTLPAGFLVGCKALTRKGAPNFGAKISEAMAQCDRALDNLGRDGHGQLLAETGGIIPVQVMQRSGYRVGKAYVVMQYDHFLQLALERAKGRAEQ